MFSSDQNAIEAVKSKIKIKEIAKVSGSKQSQIFNEVINSIPKQVLKKLPTEELIKRTIRMQRSGNNPVELTDINDLTIEGINEIFITIQFYNNIIMMKFEFYGNGLYRIINVFFYIITDLKILMKGLSYLVRTTC